MFASSVVTRQQTGDRMRALVVPGALVAALMLGLPSCVYVPVEPVPPYGYVAPVPVTPYPPVTYRRCARGHPRQHRRRPRLPNQASHKRRRRSFSRPPLAAGRSPKVVIAVSLTRIASRVIARHARQGTYSSAPGPGRSLDFPIARLFCAWPRP